MKYIAILKDSLREALDSKVFYVTIGLACLVILFFASMRFRPLPADKGLQAIVAQFPREYLPGSFREGVSYRVNTVDLVKGDQDKPWEGEYEFHLIAQNEQLEGLRFCVVAWCMENKIPMKITEKAERDFRARVEQLIQDVQHVPPDEQEAFFMKEFKKGYIAALRVVIDFPLMERYIKAMFVAHGSFEVTDIQVEALEDPAALPRHYIPAQLVTSNDPPLAQLLWCADYWSRPTVTKFRVNAKGTPNNFPVWPHSTSLLFGAIGGGEDTGGPPAVLVYTVEDLILGRFGAAISMLIATIITAFFMPNMLQKGTIDLLLVKPIPRSLLLIYKYLGGLSFMFLNTVVIVIGMWFVIGVRSGLWGNRFLLMILILTFQFATFYAFSTLFSVLTRSTIVSIMTTCFLWLVLFVVGGFLYVPPTEASKGESKSHGGSTVDAIHFALPRYTDITSLSGRLIANDLLPESNYIRKLVERTSSGYSWEESIGVTSGFILLTLGFSCWWFSRKDY